MGQPLFGDEQISGRDELGIGAKAGDFHIFGSFDRFDGNPLEKFF